MQASFRDSVYTSTSLCYFLSLTCTFSPRFTPFQPSCLLLHTPYLVFLVEVSEAPPSGNCLFQSCVLSLCYLDSIRSEQTSYKLQVPLLDFMCIYVHMCGWVLVYIYRERPESTLVSISHQHSLPPVPFWRKGLSLTKLSLRRPSKPSHLPASVFPALRPQCMKIRLAIFCGLWTLNWVLVVVWQMFYQLSCLLSPTYLL